VQRPTKKVVATRGRVVLDLRAFADLDPFMSPRSAKRSRPNANSDLTLIDGVQEID
jgi:hypothetical protein